MNALIKTRFCVTSATKQSMIVPLKKEYKRKTFGVRYHLQHASYTYNYIDLRPWHRITLILFASMNNLNSIDVKAQ